jgi:alpha-galactosidase
MQASWRAHLASVLPEDWSAALIEGHCFRIQAGDFLPDWRCRQSQRDGLVLRELYVAQGLVLDVTVTVVPRYRAFVLRMALTNESNAPSPAVTRLQPLVLTRQTGDAEVRTRTVFGGQNEPVYPPHAFREETLRLWPGGGMYAESGWDGRSSNKEMPFIMTSAGRCGVVTALEWSGTWRQEVSVNGGRLTIEAGLPVRGLVIAPGEALDLPAAHCIFFEGGPEAGTNALRRYLRDCVCPKLDGVQALPLVNYNHWFGIGPDVDESLMMVEAEAAARIGLEHFVLDAGWYGGCPRGDFEAGVGNWEVIDRAKFPNGLGPLARFVNEKGMGFGLWFEPERAHRDSAWAREHPDWFREHRHDAAGNPAYLHIDFGKEAARQGVVHLISQAIERLGLAWVKWDYNTGPLLYQGLGDPDGKALMRHVQGLYAVQDALLRAHPNVLFEACASGGRRIDIGALRRAHTVWISDHSHLPEVCRFMQCGAGRLLPGHLLNLAVPVERGAGPQAPLRPYEAACRMAGSLAFHGDIASWSAESIETARRLVEAFKSFRHLLVEDFHALAPQPVREDEWEAVQFAAPDGRDAVVMAYSGLQSGGRKDMRLHGLLAGARYSVEPVLTDEPALHASGEELMDGGLAVELAARAAAIYRLRSE